MSWIVAGSIAVGTGLLKGYQTGQAVNAQADQLERDRQNLLRQMEQTREQGRREKGLAHQSAMQSQIFGDYEEDRIRRIQEFKTSQKTAGMGGRGASIGKNSGTPYSEEVTFYGIIGKDIGSLEVFINASYFNQVPGSKYF